jgi:TolB-like protein/Tfp pilus assembly protein PilF
MSFFEELKRRNVVRVAIAYLVTSWVLMQIIDLVLENVTAPEWVMQVFMLLFAVGFPVALIFAWAFEMTPEGIKKEKDVDRTQSITPQTGRKLDFTIIGVLVVAVVFLLGDRFLGTFEKALGRSERGSEPFSQDMSVESRTHLDEKRDPTPAEAGPAKSIAVLPFVNMSSDPEQEYFSDGISEEILNALAKIKKLKVAGRTSSFAFKGENQDLRKIGEMLGVENILEGSVRKSGTKVRITAQLIQVEDGFHLWSETYDRELTDVFTIQDEIATAILVELKAHLLDGEQVVVASTRANSEAYDLYLMAKQRIYERTRPTLEIAAETLDRAIAADSNYAPAYAQRGITALLLVEDQYGTLPKEQSQTQAKLYLDQALRLDPEQPEALAGMGLYYENIPGQDGLKKSIEYLERALAINPNLINASNWLQASYSGVGRLEESMQIMEQLFERDPLYRPGIANLNRMYTFRNELQKAQDMVERVRPFMPNDPFLYRIEAGIHFAKGNLAKGLLLAEKALSIQPDNGPNVELLGRGLLSTAQFDRLLEEGTPRQRIIALRVKDRTEEAIILARELADSGEDIGSLLGVLNSLGRTEEVVQFFEDRWPSLDAFEKDYPLVGAGGFGNMLDIAYAYGSVGNAERFDDAMARSRVALDRVDELGFGGPFMKFSNAAWYTMSGNHDEALSLLSSAVEEGLVMSARLSQAWPAFKPLEGDPEYKAIQQKMTDHLNAERAELGLEPVSV